MPFMPVFLARRTYLGFTDQIKVGPPAFRHRPFYPPYPDLESGTGIAAPKSPRLRVYSFFWLELVLVIAFCYELLSNQPSMTLITLGLVVLNLALTWYAYLRWASLVFVVTHNAIYRYRGVYAAAPEMFQGADIEEVIISYRSPWKFWRWLGYGRVTVYFGKDKATVWELRGIGNAEGLGSLIRGLQTSEEMAAKELPVLMRQMIAEHVATRAVLTDMRDMMKAHWSPAAPAEATAALPSPPPEPEPDRPGNSLAVIGGMHDWLLGHAQTTLSDPPGSIQYDPPPPDELPVESYDGGEDTLSEPYHEPKPGSDPFRDESSTG